MSDISNAQASDQYTPQSQESKPQPPKIPDIRFIRTYPRRYDSSYHYHHPQELNYPYENVEIEDSKGQRLDVQTYLLRVYPEKFNDYDAYMDIPMSSYTPDIRKVRSASLGKTWEVIAGPAESPIRGYFRGDYTENNPPAWMFGLRLIQD
jgi:hypothetical protein